MRAVNHLITIVVVMAFFALAGCEPGQWDRLGDYGSIGNEIVGEISNVDTRARQIVIRTDSGRATTVRYDNNTQVIYRRQNYQVANLERGDYVAARVQQDRDGRYYTDSVTVRESAQDRGTATGGSRLDRIEGKVEFVDSRRGTFEIRDSRNRLIVVSVAFDAPRAIIDRFNRLRNGDYVRIEGRSVSADRFDLENFL